MGAMQDMGGFAAAMAGFAVNVADLPDEDFGNPERGSVTWKSLVDSDKRPSAGLTVGLAQFGAGGTLEPHRHETPEFYFCLSGAGIVTVDGVPFPVAPGVAVYLPGDAEHGTVAGLDGLTLLYVFPVDRLAAVEYRFSRAG